MIKNERHKQILDILASENYADVNGLAGRLFVSTPTIRRDLAFLENEGYIKRNHGGAMLYDDRLHHNPINFRRGMKMHEKSNICKLAATLIEKGAVVFVDDSTTAYNLSNYLGDIENITVVTNGYAICQKLLENNVKTFSTGGRFNKDSAAFVGHFAEKMISNFNADVMFFSAAAMDENGEVSDYSEEETAMRHAMKARSKKTVFLCDSDKIGIRSEIRVFSLSEIDYLVTDKPLAEELVTRCRLVELSKTADAVLYASHTILPQELR